MNPLPEGLSFVVPPIPESCTSILCACSEFSSYIQRILLLISVLVAIVPIAVPNIVLHNGTAADELHTPFHDKSLRKMLSPESGEVPVIPAAFITVKNDAL
jgi:hypothetical protein